MHHYDFDLLRFCRDPHCERPEIHAPHGRKARALTVTKRPLESYCGTCGIAWELVVLERCVYCGAHHRLEREAPTTRPQGVSRDLIDVTYAHTGTFVPTPFAELHQAVIDDYGDVTDRNVQRALRILIDERRVASLSNSMASRATQRNPRVRPPGYYIRYDSPKLWRPGGLRDLLAVAADRASEVIELRPGVRRHTVEVA